MKQKQHQVQVPGKNDQNDKIVKVENVKIDSVLDEIETALEAAKTKMGQKKECNCCC